MVYQSKHHQNNARDVVILRTAKGASRAYQPDKAFAGSSREMVVRIMREMIISGYISIDRNKQLFAHEKS